MSFDEQPDGDIHGECRLEIEQQAERIRELESERDTFTTDLADLCHEAEVRCIKAEKERDELAAPILAELKAKTLEEVAEWFVHGDGVSGDVEYCGSNDDAARYLRRMAQEYRK